MDSSQYSRSVTIVTSCLIVSAGVVILVSQPHWLAVLLILIWSVGFGLIVLERILLRYEHVQEYRLHNLWIGACERIVALFYSLFYQHYYFQYLLSAPRFQLTRHLSKQEPVVVELRIADQPAHPTSDIIAQGAPISMHIEPHAIWDYFACEQLSQVHMVIVGAPGSGKTTLLKYIARAMILGGNNYKPANIPRMIPILLFLRDH